MEGNGDAIRTSVSVLTGAIVLVLVAAGCTSAGEHMVDSAGQSVGDAAPDVWTDNASDLSGDLPSEDLRSDGDGNDADLCCPVSTPGCTYQAGGTRSPTGQCSTVYDAFPVTFEIRKDANGCDIVVQIGTELHYCNLPPEARDASPPETGNAGG